MNTTLITFFYDIGRESWNSFPRKSLDYIASFNKFLEFPYEMIIYIDDRYYSLLSDNISKSKYPETKKLIPINEKWLEDNIWSWSKLEREKEIMNSTEYKQLVQHRIDKFYPENINPYYTILTHSKIDFVNYAIEHEEVNDYIAWVDFGYFYNKLNENYIPNNVVDKTKLNLDKINLCLVNPIEDIDFNIQYTLQMAPEKIAAYFFFGNKYNMKKFQELCHEELEKFQELSIADDEQGLWLQIINKNPDLFETYAFYQWHQALRYFSL